jgi:putative transposase
MRKDLPQRKNIRLEGYDYSQNGVYFITICIKDRHCLLWEHTVGACIARPQLSDMGVVVDAAINNIHQKYEPVCVDKYVIMPNHIHMIFILKGDSGHAMRAPSLRGMVPS